MKTKFPQSPSSSLPTIKDDPTPTNQAGSNLSVGRVYSKIDFFNKHSVDQDKKRDRVRRKEDAELIHKTRSPAISRRRPPNQKKKEEENQPKIMKFMTSSSAKSFNP